MKKLDQTTIAQMRDKFRGKRISVIGDDGRYVGTCDFLGYNQFFESWGLQVTIDRMPVSNVKIKSIHLVDYII